MSAAEIIELIEKLPAEQQREVEAYFRRKQTVAGTDGVKRMDLGKAKAIGEGIFDRHSELFRKLAQ